MNKPNTPTFLDAGQFKSLNSLPETDTIKKAFNPDDYLIDLSQNIPDPVPMFSVHDKILCSAGNLLTIKAKQKAGKTTLTGTFAAANIEGQCLAIKGHEQKCIAWIDTEQSLNQVHKRARGTHRLAGLPYDRNYPGLKIYFAREMDQAERWELFEAIVQDTDNGIIILDVATDFVNDINDIAETKKAIDRILKLASKYDKLIICTIHENKNDKNATGHFGGSLQKKSEAVISLTKDKGVFTVQATDTRHGDWPDFSFIIDPEGSPVGFDTPVQPVKTNSKKERIEKVLTAILTGKRMTYTELVDEYIPCSGLKESTAKTHIGEAIIQGFIKLQADKRYTLSKYLDNETESSINF
jgi:hypothetical protein